ncbi:MAG: hypothetical protein OEY33_05665 [Bdellovibrionales bacterium]|jgi:hypothetical protein|nr:hypothetical protein [Bdellovibrionales bacterium]
MLIRITLLFLLLPSFIHAYEIDPRLKSLNFLIDQKYQFYGHRNGHFYKIGDGWIKKVAEEEIYSYKFSIKDKNRDKKKLITALYSIIKSSRDLYISKNEEVFLIRGNKVIQVYPLKSPEQDWLKSQIGLLRKEKDYQRKIEVSLCTWCQFSLSANYINLQQDSPQASAEINWIPYFKWGDHLSLITPIGLSNYLIEDEELNNTLDYALKLSAHIRYQFNVYFLEAGLGHFRLINRGDFNSMSTLGLGRYFQSNVYLFTKAINLNYLFFHYSKVNWLKPINEYKLGAGISF